MYKIILYDKNGFQITDKIDDLKKDSSKKKWIDLIDPTQEEVKKIKQIFALDSDALEQYFNGSKKPDIRVLNNQRFIILIDLNYKKLDILEKEGLYIFQGLDWLVTIHSSTFKLFEGITKNLKHKNQIIQSSINMLFINIVLLMIDKYEQVLMAIEISTSEFSKKALLSKSSKKILIDVDTLSRQIIILRRYFWQIRDIIDYLLNTIEEEDKEGIKFLKIVHDDINQLMLMVDSHKESINALRELYIANISLQLDDTVKTLTIFSAILLPLTFLTSLYGMNGLNLEQIGDIPAGLGIILSIMVGTLAGLLLFFKRKQWIFVKNLTDEKEVKQDEKNKNKHKTVS
ncbi:MAG: magnesium transporter CorA family protein [Nitrososphaeraceae archaeon]|nr:magnesium transporter CorA family protein [Nitrososphaeraceae archaeon]